MIIAKSLSRALLPNYLKFSFSLSQTKAFNYQEKAFPAEPWLTLNKNANIKDALHGGWMMSEAILPFNYDSYMLICAKVIQNQAQLKKEDILMLIKLGVKYQIRPEPFVTHIQNELFLRIHHEYQQNLIKQDEKIHEQIENYKNQLQRKSMDLYSILREEEDEQGQFDYDQLQEDNKQENKIDKTMKDVKDPVTAELNYKYSDEFQKIYQFELDDLITVANLLRQWNSTNLPLLQYLQQVLTIQTVNYGVKPSQKEANILSYLRFMTYICQQLFKEYQQNKQKYTPRSVKRIYQYQSFYFIQHLKHLQQLINETKQPQPYQISSDFIEELTKQYSLFPIKKRQIRRKLGHFIYDHLRTFNIEEKNQLLNKLVDINGKDEKMKKLYRSYFSLPEPAQNSQITEEKVEPIEEKQQMEGLA